MCVRFSYTVLLGFLVLAIIPGTRSFSQQFQLLSAVDPAQVPGSGGGDSSTPILSPDGRFVLFASTAHNLLLASNGLPIPARVLGTFQVYLRDGLNATNILVSVNMSGVGGGNGDSLPAGLSPDGHYVVFESNASNLVPGDTNSVADVFVRDILGGTTILVSAATNGPPGKGVSRSPTMTPDGRYVAFVSAASDLVAGDTNRIADVFVRDLQNNTTVLASVNAAPRPPGSMLGSSESPHLTADGRFVAFYSAATNLVPDVPPVGDIFIRDLVANATIWASSYARSVVSSNRVSCFNHMFSSDGRFLAYEAAASNWLAGTIFRYNLESGLTDVVGADAAVPMSAYEDARSLDISDDGRFIAFVANTNSNDGTTTCVRLWDAQTGGCTLVSGDRNNSVPSGSVCDWPRVYSAGRYVAFLSSATNMVTNDLSGEFHLYLRDLQEGVTTLLDLATDGTGQGVNWCTVPRLSADTSLVTFDSDAASVVAGDRNRDCDVFLHDRTTGAIELVSAHAPALSTATANGPSSIAPNSISGDGRYVVFASDADNLVTNDTNGVSDVFVRDLATATTRLLSVATNGQGADGPSIEPVISPEGRFVAFTSSADNLVPGDTNRHQDVFLCDLQAGSITLVSVNGSGTGPANNGSFSPAVSAGGGHIVFRSCASDLVPGVSSTTNDNLFLRNLQAGATISLADAGTPLFPPAITPDGRFIAYGAYSNNAPTAGFIYVWDTQLGGRVFTNFGGFRYPYYGATLTPDGRRLAFSMTSGGELHVVDFPAYTHRIIHGFTFYKDLGISTDGRWLVFRAGPPGVEVYLYDLETDTSKLVSHAFSSATAVSGVEPFSPVMSPDGRFIAYQSAATNIVPADANEQPDIFLYDQESGLNTLLTASSRGSSGGDSRSLRPVFSADGTTLLFASWASDVVPQDFNHSSDILAHTFLTAVLLPSAIPGQGPWITWPWAPGRNYRVESRDALDDLDWHLVPGSITNLGNRAFLQDPAPSTARRFYRVTSF